ncbi:phosphoribosylanthranilate isomerase [Desulfobaculum bizertense]|nr:phosphoribosylanthranilate isomerase [Desulfobaculum bizertense]UIJ38030.1 phosphoribosylanthranilate isomerase [Desulfobaculum bizertense]
MDEAQLLADCGVESLGFPLRLAVHAEDVSESTAKKIIAAFHDTIPSVLITYLTDADEILSFCEELGTSMLQLHAEVPEKLLAELKARRPELYIIKSIIMPAQASEEATSQLKNLLKEYAPYADAFLTDSYDPATGATGATGKTHDWRLDRQLVELSPCPVILAGGLNPDNVHDAILQVHPAGVDAHTGVEGPDGRKDERLLRKFVSETRKAFSALG